MRRPRRRVSAIAAVAITALSVLVSPVADAAPAAPTGGTAAGTQAPERLRVLEELNTVVAGDPDRFAGLVTDGPSKVTVNVVGDAPSSRAAADRVVRLAEAAGIRTDVRYREHSLRELTTVKDTIDKSAPFAALGKDLLSWGVDAETNSVRVGVAEVTPELTERVRTAFGDKVTLERGVRAVPAAGRFNNNPNFVGGNRIRVGTRHCTSGFTITNATGLRYALTAGHCFALGAEPVVDGINRFFGTVQFRRWADTVRIDNELIGVNVYRGAVWEGGVTGDLVSRPVHNAANSCQGCNVYFDGSVTGQALATIDTAGNSTDCINIGGTACHVVRVHGPGGAAVCTHGDSGGPVFAYDGQGGVTAVGIITAVALNPDETPNPNVCWYTRIVPILAHWQATITTE